MVTNSEEARLVTPREFEALPCIVQPKDATVAEICSMLADIAIVDRTCLPLPLAMEAENISTEFTRLLGALEKIELSRKTSTTTLLESAAQALPRIPLWELVKAFLEKYRRRRMCPIGSFSED